MASIHLVIATRGRATEVGLLLKRLERQTLPASHVWLVIEMPADAESPIVDAAVAAKRVTLLQAEGLTRKRNHAIDAILSSSRAERPIVVFFDDDFWPSDNWLEAAAAAIASDPTIAGLTGHVLADGSTTQGVSPTDAERYLSRQWAPEKHWTEGDRVRDIRNVYGCNMAFTAAAVQSCRFDENLRSSAWLEDADFSGKVRQIGRIVCVPSCQGVHLSSKAARDNGVVTGYRQVATPIYLIRSGTLDRQLGTKLILKNLIANHARALKPEPWVDRRGRCFGNWRALFDIVLCKDIMSKI